MAANHGWEVRLRPRPQDAAMPTIQCRPTTAQNSHWNPIRNSLGSAICKVLRSEAPVGRRHPGDGAGVAREARRQAVVRVAQRAGAGRPRRGAGARRRPARVPRPDRPPARCQAAPATRTVRHRLRAACLPLVVPGLGRGDGPPSRGHRGGAGAHGPEPGRGGLREVGPFERRRRLMDDWAPT